jgi:hypothetical protein
LGHVLAIVKLVYPHPEPLPKGEGAHFT